MSEMSATVLSVEGAVVAMNADGMPRVLQVGEKVLPGETVVAGEGASLQLLTVDGDVVPLASGQRLVFGEEMIEATRLTRADAAVDPLSVEAVLQAIEAGQALDDVLEAPAAGLAGGVKARAAIMSGWGVSRRTSPILSLSMFMRWAMSRCPFPVDSLSSLGKRPRCRRPRR